MRELSAMLGATAYAGGIMLGAFMTGLGLGALIGTIITGNVKRPLMLASRVELAIAVLSIVAFLGIRYLPGYYFNWMRSTGASNPSSFLALQFATCFLVMALPTTAMGMTYPLIMRAVGRDSSIGSLSAKLYAVNTVGAIIGSLIATFSFLPLVGVKGSLVIAAILSVLVAILLRSLTTPRLDVLALFKTPEILVAGITLIILIAIPARADSPLGLGQAFYYLSAQDFERAAAGRTTLFDQEGLYSRVQVIKDSDGTRRLYNGALDEGTDNDFDRVTTAMIAAVPAFSVENTGEALVVGLGTGFTSETYFDLGFEQTTTVEINPQVLPASSFFLDQDFAGSDRWTVVVDDARAFILTSPDLYDCISSEPSWPWSSGVAALFTEEFMMAAKTRLKPEGVYCQWLPNYLLRSEDVEMMYKTMRQVYDRVDVWAINFSNVKNAELLLVGFNDRNSVDQEIIKKRLDDLIDTGQFNNEFIVTDCITPYSEVLRLEAALADSAVPINTDDHSTLEYRVFWNFVRRALDPLAWESSQR
ncbi:MAG: fused MFS/spermidine synthase [Coriobacteriia bacterium]|nr:fused MFS/spermidine synthase [Coriobacteriia bacterium]